MIASFRPGMRHDVSISEHRLELRKRRVNGMESHARRVSRQMYWRCFRQLQYGADRTIALSQPVLESLAQTYGVQPELVAYAVSCTRQLLQQRGVV
jgi:hypothetical protein